MTAYPWPDRETWAKRHQTAYADDVAQITGAVSTDPGDYGTDAEIQQAVTELRECWNRLGREVRTANDAARRVFLLHGHQPRTRAARIDNLSAEDRAIVDQAIITKDHRARVNEAITNLANLRNRYLDQWVSDRILRYLPACECPTWRTLVHRWQQAQGSTAAGYADRTRRQAVDEDAWRAELDRRAEIELWRARGPIRSLVIDEETRTATGEAIRVNGMVAAGDGRPAPQRVHVAGNRFHPQVPATSVYVGRESPYLKRSPYANRHPIGHCRICGEHHDRPAAVAAYAHDLAGQSELVAAARRDLAGRDLACWCHIDLGPCHADLLLLVVAGADPLAALGMLR
jgi:hypothetical protein